MLLERNSDGHFDMQAEDGDIFKLNDNLYITVKKDGCKGCAFHGTDRSYSCGEAPECDEPSVIFERYFSTAPMTTEPMTTERANVRFCDELFTLTENQMALVIKVMREMEKSNG